MLFTLMFGEIEHLVQQHELKQKSSAQSPKKLNQIFFFIVEQRKKKEAKIR